MCMKALSFLLLLTISAAACTGAPESKASDLGRHRGAVLSAPPDAVWAASRDALAPLGTVQVEGDGRTASVRTSGGRITVRVEPYDAAATRSILRVSAESQGESRPEIADRLQLEIQRALLSR